MTDPTPTPGARVHARLDTLYAVVARWDVPGAGAAGRRLARRAADKAEGIELALAILREGITGLCDAAERDNYGRLAVDVYDLLEAIRDPKAPR